MRIKPDSFARETIAVNLRTSSPSPNCIKYFNVHGNYILQRLRTITDECLYRKCIILCEEQRDNKVSESKDKGIINFPTELVKNEKYCGWKVSGLGNQNVLCLFTDQGVLEWEMDRRYGSRNCKPPTFACDRLFIGVTTESQMREKLFYGTSSLGVTRVRNGKGLGKQTTLVCRWSLL